jgi:hypothetical protein
MCQGTSPVLRLVPPSRKGVAKTARSTTVKRIDVAGTGEGILRRL